MRALNSSDARLLNDAIEVVKSLKTQDAVPALVRLATSPAPRQRPSRTGPRLEPIPVAAILALTEIDESAATPVIADLLNDSATSGGTRWRLEKAMYHLRQPASYETLIEVLRVVPQSVESTMVRGLSGSAGGGESLLATIEAGHLSPRLLRDPRVNVNLQYADIENLDARIAKLVEGLPTEDERLSELIQSHQAGFAQSQPDAKRGNNVFIRSCSICHSVRGQGARIGPELDGIGMRGLDRLLEDIIDPNRNVDATFQASVISLRDGRIATGRILDNDGQVLTLVDYQGVEQKYVLSEVSNFQQIKMSSMPANLTETMTANEFYDLLSYLLAQRQSPPPTNP
jgi:putative heme-binding domain-containing protein